MPPRACHKYTRQRHPRPNQLRTASSCITNLHKGGRSSLASWGSALSCNVLPSIRPFDCFWTVSARYFYPTKCVEHPFLASPLNHGEPLAQLGGNAVSLGLQRSSKAASCMSTSFRIMKVLQFKEDKGSQRSSRSNKRIGDITSTTKVSESACQSTNKSQFICPIHHFPIILPTLSHKRLYILTYVCIYDQRALFGLCLI